MYKVVNAIKCRSVAGFLPRFVSIKRGKHGRGLRARLPWECVFGTHFPDLVVTFPVKLRIGHRGHGEH
jgi:hypothetical protein